MIQKTIEQTNVEKMAAYFKAGEKDKCVKTGVEIEHFVIGEGGNSMCYEDMAHFLEALMEENDRAYLVDGHLLGFFCTDYSISLEPAAQLEISIAPKETVGEIQAVYEAFRKKADVLLEKSGFRLINTGYHPYKKAEELSLIPKKRYEYMNRYFETSGKLGKNMMRATASTQVSIDYENEADFVEKYRLACILSPVLALLTDNSPVFEGKQAGMHMVRTAVWMDTDKARCGIFPGTFSEDFGYRKYAEYLYNNPPILIMDENGVATATGKQTLREIYADKEMTTEEIEHAISMFFPDVRLKNYIEIRMADSMELPCVLEYTVWIKTLFYHAQAREELRIFLGKADEEMIEQAKLELIEKGFAGKVYGKKVSEIVKKLAELVDCYGGAQAKRYAGCLMKKAVYAEKH